MSNKIEQKGAKKMTTEHQTTPEEEAYERLLEEKWEMLSGAARNLVNEALSAAYIHHLIRNAIFDPADYEEAMEKMHCAATKITGEDLELLARLWRLALAAAASIDPHDSTLAGFRVDAADFHGYYRMLSGMVEEVVEKVLGEKMAELRQKREQLGPEDFEDSPF